MYRAIQQNHTKIISHKVSKFHDHLIHTRKENKQAQYMGWDARSVCVSITRNLAPHWRVSARNAPFGYEIWDLCVALAARGDGDALQPSGVTLSENTPNSHLTWVTAKQVYQRKQKLAHFSKAYRDDLENRMWSCALFGTNLKWEEPGQKIRLVHNIY